MALRLKPPPPIKRDEIGAGGVGVYGNPNFKPFKKADTPP